MGIHMNRIFSAAVFAAYASATDYYGVYQHQGDCYDTGEFGNGQHETGEDCVVSCASQGSYVANYWPDGGYCYCEWMDVGQACVDYSADSGYELWNAYPWEDESDAEVVCQGAYCASIQRAGDCYDTSEFSNGSFASGTDCAFDCAAQGSYVSNYYRSGGSCYCEYMEMGAQCSSYGSENYYDLYEVSYANFAPVLQQAGDCYDTSEWYNGTFDSGEACIESCVSQGSYLANISVGYGSCYCEYADYGHYCSDVGAESYYDLWSVVATAGDYYAAFVMMGDCYSTSEWYAGDFDSG